MFSTIMKCAVIIHIFYTDLIDELASVIKNICDIDIDVFITIPSELESSHNLILSKFENATLITVKNVGYDIWPFIFVLNQINLNIYDFVIKIHTKRNILQKYTYIQGGTSNIGGNEWRKKLLRFISSKENFERSLNNFKNPKVGMVTDYSVLTNYKYDPRKKIYPEIEKLMQSFNFKYTENACFVAGSMFMIRASLLKYLQNAFTEDEFDAPDIERTHGLAHILERVFGYAIYAQGFEIVSFDSKNYEREILKAKWKRLFYRKKSTGNHIVTKCLGIPVFFQKEDNC